LPFVHQWVIDAGVSPAEPSLLIFDRQPTPKQVIMTTTARRGEVPVMMALRLFLPENWTLDRAGIPAEYRTARTKPELPGRRSIV
jgi:hypothetical protein